jgi:uncharacterized protein
MADSDRAGHKVLVYARWEETSHHARAREILNNGNFAHDADIVALIVEHRVAELWTADRDFARFSGIRVRNPFDTQN